ncbi:MAG TPA: peptidylprolyl isomerase [Porphyromonadaceae bacterium]|nr:peptidylprolyl isomerase [Porphyromonadaceae bacterium]
MEEIKKGKFVSMTYKLFVRNDEGNGEELSEEAPEERPLQFICGDGEMLASFEKNLMNKKAGDEIDFKLSPKEAYGERNEGYVKKIPKKVFEVKGAFDADMVYVGSVVPMLDAEGNKFRGLVLEVGTDAVTVDFNHPFAGEELHFTGKILEVRDAKEGDKHHCCHCDGCGQDSECDGDCNCEGCH